MATKNIWFKYWETQNSLMNANMHKNNEILIRNLPKLFKVGKNDKVLDIGAGQGYLEEYLSGKVKEIYCLETSANSIETLKNKFSDNPTIKVKMLRQKDYTDLSVLGNKQFTLVFCVGVVPYYKNIKDLKKLIISVKKHCKNGLLLIADLKVKEDLAGDVFGLIKSGIAERYLINPILFMVSARLGFYYRVLKNRGLLVTPENKLKEIIKDLKLDAKIVDIPLSINPERKHLLIRF
jgi:2-polyprenyl-3-methyl-5-hydroxy-6-metoxy-1,4-benzoquinol methylase